MRVSHVTALLCALAVAVSATPTAQEDVPSVCMAGYALFDGRCYKWDLTPRIWLNARNSCIADTETDLPDNSTISVDLLTIHSEREGAWVQLPPNTPSSPGQDWTSSVQQFPDSMDAHTLGATFSSAEGGGDAGKGGIWLGLWQTPQGSEAVWQFADGASYYWYNRYPKQNDNTWVAPADDPYYGYGYFWKPDKPNNVISGQGSPGEDCAHTSSQGQSLSGWNDNPCDFFFPSICVHVARCPDGWFLRTPYTAHWPLGPSANQTYSAGVCRECEGGTYRDATVPQDKCEPCEAGFYGGFGAALSTCDAPCERGFYCPEGTATNNQVPCPEGKYGVGTGGSSEVDACESCPAGSYCPGGTALPLACGAGTCGFDNQVVSTCSQPCPMGYYCPAGSICPSLLEHTGEPGPAHTCGDKSLYCPSGSSNPISVPPGYYSIGGSSEETRTSIVACEKGHYCSGGDRVECPAGTYRGDVRGETLADCLDCTAGFFCDKGSTTPTSEACAPDSSLPPGSSPRDAQEYYCPAGTEERLLVSKNHYTLPDDRVDLVHRESQAPCTGDLICYKGFADPKLSWVKGCENGVFFTQVDEMEISGYGNYTAEAALNLGLSGFGYDVTYHIDSFEFYDIVTFPECAAVDASTNLGVFDIDEGDGRLLLTNDRLQFEVCPPNADVRYSFGIRATADNGTDVANLYCAVEVTVMDANDYPEFPTSVQYRYVAEKQLKDEPARRCDATLVAEYGCPVAETSPIAVTAYDEDIDPEVTYSITPNTFDRKPNSDDWRFKINPCTGVVSMLRSKEISYTDNTIPTYVFNGLPRKAFKLEITATDDGSGGAFEPLSNTTTLFIFITDLNDPPTLQDPDDTDFEIQENQIAGTIVGAPTWFDEDGDDVTLFIDPILLDGASFEMSNNLIQTTSFGAANIDFESSKQIYSVVVKANDGEDEIQEIYQINVLNANDAPVFVDSLSFYLRENLIAPVCRYSSGICASSTTHTVHTTDVDVSLTDDTSYAMVTPHAFFDIHPTSGQVFSTAALNFEDEGLALGSGTGRGVRFDVVATSNGGGTGDPTPRSATATITVYIVDENEPPTAETLAVTVLENAEVGSRVAGFSMQLTDRDNADALLFGVAAPMQSISYAPAPSPKSGNAFFTAITTAGGIGKLLVASALDFESCVTQPCMVVHVRATDNGGPVQRHVDFDVEVSLGDSQETPRFAEYEYFLSVSEASPKNARVNISTLFATDGDAVGDLSYKVVGGSGTSLYDIETILPGPGAQFVVYKKEGVQLDYENPVKRELTLIVEASDEGPPYLIGTPCVAGDTCGSIGAFCDVTGFCFETCYDTDLGATALSVSSPRKDLYFCDYPIGHTPDVTNNTNTATTTLTISVTDANDAPLIIGDFVENSDECIIQRTVTRSLQKKPQVAVASLDVFDADAVANVQPNSPYVFYEVVETAEDLDFWSTFDLTTNTGKIGTYPIVTEGVTDIPLTIGHIYNGTVGVEDTIKNPSQISRNSTCKIEVTVIDFNTIPTLPAYATRYVYEKTGSMHIVLGDVGNLTAIDLDTQSDPPDVLQWFLGPTPYFQQDLNTGQIFTTAVPLDFETTSVLQVIMRVVDSKGAEDTATLVVKVIDVNEKPFWLNVPSFNVREDAEVGVPVIGPFLDIYAFDPDTYNSSFNVLTFDVVGCAGSCPFVIDDPSTGTLKLASPLDFEDALIPNTFTFQVSATDPLGLVSLATITVNVEDINEKPNFTGSLSQNIPEGEIGATLFDFAPLVVDLDAGDSLTFYLISGGDGLFEVTPSGLLIANGSVDYENEQNYNLVVRVNDTGDLHDENTIAISVDNINDVVITSVIADNATAACDGGTWVTIAGRNFGMKSPAATPATVSLEYTTRRGKSYSTTNCVVLTRNTQVRCKLGAGVGVDLTFALTVFVAGDPQLGSPGDTSNAFSTSLSYDKPIVSSVTGPTSPLRLDTGASPTALTISGTCLGDTTDELDFASGTDFVEYCNSVGTCYKASDCVVSSLNTLACTSVPGVGVGLEWQANIASQSSLASLPLGRYLAPALSQAAPTVLSTAGTTAVTLTGTQFGNVGTPVDRVYFRYSYAHTHTGVATAIDYEMFGCAVTVAYTTIACGGATGLRTSKGVGSNMPVFVGFATQFNAASPVVVSYTAPTTTQLAGEGLNGAPTTGGALVTVTGTSFGPVCGAPGETPCGRVFATYTRGSTSPYNGNALITYRPQCAVVSQTSMVCKIAPGTGAGHAWSFIVGGSPAPVSPPQLSSYSSPTVGAYDGDGAVDAPTIGGDEIILQGSNFGPIAGATIVGYYGDEFDEDEFGPVLDCNVTKAHEEVTCRVLEGAGKDLEWFLLVDGLRSQTELTKYDWPELHSVEGSTVLSNDGYQTLNITGFDLGPPTNQTLNITGFDLGPPDKPAYLEEVTYGPTNNLFAYTANCVVLDHTKLQCITSPGVGSNMRMRIVVKGQESQAPHSQFALKYTTPDLIGISPTGGTTNGGYEASLEVIGAGLCDDESFVEVTFAGVVVPVKRSLDADGAEIGVDVFCPGSGNLPLLNPSETRFVVFDVPAMASPGNTRTASWRIVSTRLENPIEVISPQGNGTFRYNDPKLENVFSELNEGPGGGVRVTFTGSNFCENDSCCQAYIDGAQATTEVSHGHNQIVVIHEGTGDATVRCGSIETEAQDFDSSTPSVFGTVPLLNSKSFPTYGGENVTIWGLFLGSPDAGFPNVTFGGFSAEVLTYVEKDCSSPLRPTTATGINFDPQIKCNVITVEVPEGVGANLPMVVETTTGQTTTADDIRFEFLSYFKLAATGASGPVGTPGARIDPNEVPVSTTITGTNFGPSPGGTVYVGDPALNMTCVPTAWTHDSITCDLPVGEGSGLPLVVVDAAGNTLPVPGAVVNYEPPSDVIISSKPMLYETEGGVEVVELSGRHFGRPYDPQCADETCSRIGPSVLVGPVLRTCVLLESNSTYVRCLAPEGEGRNLVVSVCAGGSCGDASPRRLSYAPPEIDRIFPDALLPTDALDSQNNRMKMVIQGKNFGIDKLDVLLDDFVVASRRLSFFKNDFKVSETNHTVITLDVPEYYGVNRSIVVVVDGQRSDQFEKAPEISYRPPLTDELDIVTSEGTALSFTAASSLKRGNFSALLGGAAWDPTYPGLPATLLKSIGRRRLIDFTEPMVYWSNNATSTKCVVEPSTQDLTWKEDLQIAPNGEYSSTRVHYESFTECLLGGDPSFTIVRTGQFFDHERKAVQPLICGRYFEDLVDSMEITVLSPAKIIEFNNPTDGCAAACGTFVKNVPKDVSECFKTVGVCQGQLRAKAYVTFAGQSEYGVYVMSGDNSEIYLTSVRQRTLVEAQNAAVFRFPQDATASVVDSEAIAVAFGPTDGCYEWEPLSTYFDRLAAAQELLGVETIPRICRRKTLLTMTGSSFGSDILGEPGALRVFFEDQTTGTRYEAATTTSTGNRGELCPTSVCEHTHLKITVWAPYGTGQGLKIIVRVGNQEAEASQLWSYESPVVNEALPGSVRLGHGFQDAAGGKFTLFRGRNFGGLESEVSILINGRECTNAQWWVGADDSGGRSFASCDPPLDVVGPKTVISCIANSTSIAKVFRSDVNALFAGDAAGVWEDPTITDTVYHRSILSVTTSKCAPGQTGRVYELCQDCPYGATCSGGGGFNEPIANATFSKLSIAIYEEDGSTITERALARCDNKTYHEAINAPFPDWVPRPDCLDFVKCIPDEACAGDNQCANGYEYSLYTCQAARDELLAQDPSANNCTVVQNPLTQEWSGIHSECRGELPLDQECEDGKPEECSLCVPVYEDGGTTPSGGRCQCQLPRRCALCTVKTHFRLNGECAKCPKRPGLLIAMFVLGALAAIAAGYFLEKKKFNLAFVSIGIDYFQVLAIFAQANVEWPDELQSVFNVFSVFNFNIDIAAPECLVPNFEYTTKYWFTMTLPLLVLGVLLITHLTYTTLKIVRYGARASVTSHVSKMMSIYLTMFYVLYLSVTRRALDTFNCNPTNPDDGFRYTQFTSLKCDGGSLCRCDEPGGVQTGLRAPSIVFLIIYTAGFPLFIAYVLKTNYLAFVEDQYLRAHDIGDSRETNPHAYDLRKRYSKLYYHFKPDHVYWIVYILLRKFGIAFAALMFRANGSFQLSMILLVLFASFVVHVLHRPYMSTGEHGSVLRELDYLASTKAEEDQEKYRVFVEIKRHVEHSLKIALEMRRKALSKSYKLNSKGGFWKQMQTREPDRQKIADRRNGKVQKYFFDYNTVEMVLLGSAILIALSGIMFDSGRFEGREDLQQQRNTITTFAMLIIVFSIAYYFLVFVAELGLSYIDKIAMFCAGNKADPYDDEDLDRDLNLTDNAMFKGIDDDKVDVEVLRKQLEAAEAEFRSVERENKNLREAIRKGKMEEQLDEQERVKDVRSTKGGPKTRRKQFGQSKA